MAKALYIKSKDKLGGIKDATQVTDKGLTSLKVVPKCW